MPVLWAAALGLNSVVSSSGKALYWSISEIVTANPSITGSGIMAENFDIAVVGGGLAGVAAALSAAQSGYKIALISPRPKHKDGRTTALMLPSIDLLEMLGVWSQVAASAAPLRHMRIIDGTSRLVRAPTVTFHSRELDLDAFGYNIPNAPLLDALNSSASAASGIMHIEQSVCSVIDTENEAKLLLDDGRALSASLVVGADGRNSKVREAANIRTKDWRYPQTAIVLNFSHTHDHSDTSNEFHTESGPFTQVPLPGKRSSLVWALSPNEAETMLTASVDELSIAVETKMHSLLGKVQIEGSVQSFPFSGMIARSFGEGRMVLVGEAGHVFPPIGAQGLNLGLRDVVDLTNELARLSGLDHVRQAVSAYNRARRSDVISRTASVDLLNRTLLSNFLPVQLARSAGLAVLSGMGPLRNFAMREGMKPGTGIQALRRNQRPT